MKQLVSIFIAVLVAITAFGQSSPPNKLRSNDLFTQVDNYLVAAKRLGIPSGPTPTLDASTTSENSTKLFYDTDDGLLMVYDISTSTWSPVSSDVDLTNYYTRAQVDSAITAEISTIPSPVWGNITGTLSAQTDLQNALNAKENAANKVNNMSSPNSTTFPTTAAVQSYVQSQIPAAQTLSLGANAGEITISGGNSIQLPSLSRGQFITGSFEDAFTSLPIGFNFIANTTGSTGFPVATGQGFISKRASFNNTQGAFAIWKSNSPSDRTLQFNVGVTGADWNGWETFASREWAVINTLGNQSSHRLDLVTGNTDLNSLTIPNGVWGVNVGAIANTPATSSGTIYNFRTGASENGTNFNSQIYHAISNSVGVPSRLFARHYNSREQEWADWVQLATLNDIPTNFVTTNTAQNETVLTGNKSWGGMHTFTQPVTVATPTAANHAATKQYVDGMPGFGLSYNSTSGKFDWGEYYNDAALGAGVYQVEIPAGDYLNFGDKFQDVSLSQDGSALLIGRSDHTELLAQDSTGFGVYKASRIDDISGAFLVNYITQSGAPRASFILTNNNDPNQGQASIYAASNITLNAGNNDAILSMSPGSAGVTMTSAGDIQLFTPSGAVRASQLSTSGLVIHPTSAPASSTAAGTAGEVRITEDYVYVCIDTNTWRRIPLENW